MLADSYRPLIALQLKDKEAERKKKRRERQSDPRYAVDRRLSSRSQRARSIADWGTTFPGPTPHYSLPGCVSARPPRTDLGFQPAGRKQLPEAPPELPVV